MAINVKKRVVLLFVLLVFPLGLLLSQSEDVSAILDENKEGVISFVTYGDDDEEISRGTGFVVSHEIMATAYHLVSQAKEAEGRNYKGKKVKIEGIIAADRDFDTALLKIKGKRQVLPMGDSVNLEPGNKVYAIGSDESGDIIVSDGEIRNLLRLSAAQRVVTSSLAVPETFCGSPVLDSEGTVMGMVIFLDRGSKFILPANILKTLSARGKSTKFKDWEHQDYFSTYQGAFLAGRVYSSLDETNKARKALEKVIEFQPENIEAHALLSSVYTKDRNYQAAVKAFQKVIELDPDRRQAYYGLGIVYLKMRKHKEAIDALEKALQLGLDNEEVYYHIGSAYEELKDYAKAAQAYENFVNMNPQNPWTGYLRLGLTRMELEDYEGAVAALQEALKLKPQDIKTNFTLAQAYHEAGEFQKAEQQYESLAQLNPEDANVYYRRILNMYDKAGMQEEAIGAAKKLIELNPDSEINVYNLGIMYMKLERYDEAIQTFRDVLAIRPNYDYAYYNIGFSYSKQKKHQQAIEAFEKYVELAPDSAEGWFNIGVEYMLIKKFAKAQKPLQKAVELKPDYGLAYYNLAITYLNLKDNYSAREIHKKLTTIDPALAQKLEKILR